MKKVIGSVLIIYVLIALYSLTFNTDLSIYGFINGLSNVKWKDLPIDSLHKIIDSFDSVKELKNVSYKDIIKPWRLFDKLSSLIVSGFNFFYYFVKIQFDILGFAIGNIYEFLKFLFTFLKPNL